MAQTTTWNCDCCGDKIDGRPKFHVAWVEILIAVLDIGTSSCKEFCSFNCLVNFVTAEQARRVEKENG